MDVLQIDVEGYDAELVTGLDLDAHRPTVVCFADSRLSAADHEPAVAHLRRTRYRFAVDEDDTLAIH